MTFAWPYALLGLLLLPVLVAVHLWLLRRRRRRTVSYSSVALIRAASPSRAGWKRHVPAALLLGALACLGLAAGRPQVPLDVPVSQAAVILALDVSGSMCATDVDPNRLTAAQTAVREFVRTQDSRTRIGLVVFSGFAQLAVPPTTDRDEVLQTIDTLTTGRGTTIGAAILKSVDAIAQINPDVAPADPGTGDTGTAPGVGPDGSQDGTGGSTGGATPAPQAPNGAVPVAPEIVVLLTDGANTRGIAPLEAAKIAAARGVRVYPIGFGTTNPTSLVCSAEQLGGSSFGQGFGQGGGAGGGFGGGGTAGGRRNFLVADEATLKQVAVTTGGQYFSAQDATQLKGVLADLPRHVKVQHRDLEISVGLAGLAVLLVVGAAAAAVRWTTFPA